MRSDDVVIRMMKRYMDDTRKLLATIKPGWRLEDRRREDGKK